MNTNTTAPTGVVSSTELGKWAERAAFERWYASTDARYWNTSDAAYAAWCAAAEAERERICAAIKAEDDHCADGDYMLDSNDCIKVARGEWVRPDWNPPNTN
jgi:hypothetical protein